MQKPFEQLMTLFNNKYRIETTRLNDRDYGGEGAYFITICTKNKEHFFGKIHNDEMLLNDAGKLVHHEWEQTPVIRPDMNLTLEGFVIMPNHMHGIMRIGKNAYNKEEHNNRPGKQSKSLATVIGGFKSTVTRQLRKSIPYFAWQERYYDHIIRNENEHNLISRYISNNPANWKEDQFYK